MKKTILKIFILFLSLIFCELNSQDYQDACLSTAKISTNPKNPINEKDCNPHKKLNNFFDWTTQYYPIYSNAELLSSSNNFLSPFWDGDAFYYKDKILNDMKPEDGWELIRVKRGYIDQTIYANGNPIDFQDNTTVGEKPAQDQILWLVLYNKYSSKLRIFITVGDNRSYTGARVNIFFNTAYTNGIKTNLLMFPEMDQPLIPVDQIPSVTSLAFASQYQANANRWTFAEFPMVYDPCTCFYKSEIVIDLWLIDNSKITLTGIFDGTIVTDIKNHSGSINDNNKTYSLDNLQKVGQKAVGTYNSGQKFVDDSKKTLEKYVRKEIPKVIPEKTTEELLAMSESEMNSYMSDYIEANVRPGLNKMWDDYKEQHSGLTVLKTALANSSIFQSGLQAIPYLGAAISLVDFFSGGGSTTNPIQQVALQPMTINAKINLTGDITKDAQSSNDDIEFFNPGSIHAYSNSEIDNVPIYDQVLGTFNLLKKPELKYYHNRSNSSNNIRTDIVSPDGYANYDEVTISDHFQFQIPNNIDYLINPASGLKSNSEDVDIFASIVVQFPSDPLYNDTRFTEFGMDAGFSKVNDGGLFFSSDYDNFIFQKERNVYMTRPIPLQCLNNVTMKLASNVVYNGYSYIYDGGTPHTSENDHYYSPSASVPTFNAWIDLIVHLKRKDKEQYPNSSDIIYKGKYPVKLTELTTDPNWSTPYYGYFKDITLQDQIISSDIFAWGDIKIGDNVTVSSTGGPYKITASNRIIDISNSPTPRSDKELNPKLILQTGVDKLCTTAMYGPVSSSEITSFCYSNSNQTVDYRPDLRTFSKKSEGENNSKVSSNYFNISPNPANKIVHITYSIIENENLKISISNFLGEEIKVILDRQENLKLHDVIDFNTSELTSGIYFVNFQTSTGVETRKLIIIK